MEIVSPRMMIEIEIVMLPPTGELKRKMKKKRRISRRPMAQRNGCGF